MRQVGLDWHLLLSSNDPSRTEKILLEIVPWLGMGERPEVPQTEQSLDGPLSRVLAWPNLSDDHLYSSEVATDGLWVQLSPFDLYGVERFGYLVDQLLQRELVSEYGRPITKVPTSILGVASQVKGLSVSTDNHQIRVFEALAAEDASSIERALISENALAQAADLRRRQRYILALQRCPVCRASATITHQKASGFIAICRSCVTKRYLRNTGQQKVYEQSLAGISDFRLVGRRSFLLNM